MKPSLRFHVATLTVLLLSLAAPVAAPAQVFTSLASFDVANGDDPEFSFLVQGLDGNFHGTTPRGGANSDSNCNLFTYLCGTLFKVTPEGKLTVLHNFCDQPFCAVDGDGPFEGLVLATDENFYGTTSFGGADNSGIAFRISSTGWLVQLHSFCSETNCADGGGPSALIQATDGNFYGTTSSGGAYNYGTIFRLAPQGKLTTLYSFCAQASCPDGQIPGQGGLVQATDGNFYGTTYAGGEFNSGTAFKITPSGVFTLIYSFCSVLRIHCNDGEYPNNPLIQGSDGNFYGTAMSGGVRNNGMIFQLTPTGTLTTLHSLEYGDGQQPFGPLVQGSDGNFYGMTNFGGYYDYGTIFEITSEAVFTVLQNFEQLYGAYPYGGLVQGTDGTFYGATSGGGSSSKCGSEGCGTIFSLNTGLGPFISALPTSGEVGSKVILLGNNLVGSTAVTFNGTAATFRVVSPTEIRTTVPTGATTGKVQVTTPGGTLTSNVVFRVR